VKLREGANLYGMVDVDDNVIFCVVFLDQISLTFMQGVLSVASNFRFQLGKTQKTGFGIISTKLSSLTSYSIIDS
jgi:hypothetical protein